MDVLLTCKNEEDPIKNEGASVLTTFSPLLPYGCHGNQWSHLTDFELIQALMHVLITCKYEKDPSKNSVENVMTSFSPL